MLQIPSDISILGIAFSIVLLIIVVSAIILYLAFRVRETFRDEKGRGLRLLKLAFLVGVLFLGGGMLFFFATSLRQPVTLSFTTTSNSSTTTSEASLSTNTTTTTTRTSNTTSVIPVEQTIKIELIPSYPEKVRKGSEFSMSFTLVNSGSKTAHDVMLQFNQLLSKFYLVSSSHGVEGNVILVGDVKGTVLVLLELKAPSKPSRMTDSVTLTYNEMKEPAVNEITISIQGEPV